MGQFGDPIALPQMQALCGKVVVADLDLDTDNDIIGLLCETERVRLVWIPNDAGTGNFLDPATIFSVESPEATATYRLEDLNGDERMDIVAYRSRPTVDGGSAEIDFAWYENGPGESSFTRRDLPGLGRLFRVIDVDGDGDLDLASGGGGMIHWLENTDGAGSFGSLRDMGDRGDFLADLDGDGDQDAVFADWNAAGSSYLLRWWPFDPSFWNFQWELVRTIYSGESNLGNLIVLDADGDGDVDLLALTSGAWLENAGGGLAWREGMLSFKATDFELRDLEGDGDVDLVTKTWVSTPETYLYQWYLSEPGGFLREGPRTSAGSDHFRWSHAWADLDCDEDLDELTITDLGYVDWNLLTGSEYVHGGQYPASDPYLLLADQLVGSCGADLLMREGEDIVLRESLVPVTSTAARPTLVPELRVGKPYPNPATSSFELPVSGPVPGDARIELRDALGRVVRERRVALSEGRSLRFDLGRVAPGLYLYRLWLDAEVIEGSVVVGE